MEPLPALAQGESLPLQGVDVHPGKTSPPGHLTEVIFPLCTRTCPRACAHARMHAHAMHARMRS